MSKKRPSKPKTYEHVRDKNYTLEDATREWEEYFDELDAYREEAELKKRKYHDAKRKSE